MKVVQRKKRWITQAKQNKNENNQNKSSLQRKGIGISSIMQQFLRLFHHLKKHNIYNCFDAVKIIIRQ